MTDTIAAIAKLRKVLFIIILFVFLFLLIVWLHNIFCNEIDAAKIENLSINEKKNGGT